MTEKLFYRGTKTDKNPVSEVLNASHFIKSYLYHTNERAQMCDGGIVAKTQSLGGLGICDKMFSKIEPKTEGVFRNPGGEEQPLLRSPPLLQRWIACC